MKHPLPLPLKPPLQRRPKIRILRPLLILPNAVHMSPGLIHSPRNIPQLDEKVPEPYDPGLDDPGPVNVVRSVPPDD